MTLQRTTIVCLATLGLGVLATGAALMEGPGFSRLFHEFQAIYLLPLSPYVVFGGACFLADSSFERAITTLVVCALATAFAIYYYGDLLFVHPGSMSGLVFFFVPSFQLPVAFLLLIVMFILRLCRRGSARA